MYRVNTSPSLNFSVDQEVVKRAIFRVDVGGKDYKTNFQYSRDALAQYSLLRFVSELTMRSEVPRDHSPSFPQQELLCLPRYTDNSELMFRIFHDACLLQKGTYDF